MTVPPQDVIDAARSAQAKWQIPASITIAQWALESGWGKHVPAGSNNCFGMKCRAGMNDPAVTMRTREVDHAGREYFIDAAFRRFDTLAHAFEEHAKLLATAKVYARARTKLPDPEAFADALTGTYATDPKYGALLKSIMRGSRLHQYDLGD